MDGRITQMIGLSTGGKVKLDPALILLRDTQASLLGAGTGNAGIADTIGAVALENEYPAPVSETFATDILAKLHLYESTYVNSIAAAQAAGNALDELLSLPQPLRDASLNAAGKLGWTFAGPGVKSMMLDTGGQFPTRLLRIQPGYGAPNHDHTGTEYTLVVKGAFRDGTGRFGPGDLSIKRPGQTHHPIANAGDICFAVAVEEGDVSFTGALGFIQRLFARD